VLTLPIDEAVPEIVRRVLTDGVLVLEAPPGAGKTTRVPPALLAALGDEGEVVVLEPRRIAARMAARRVAEELGERVGDRVGYTVRFEDVTSRATRLCYVTEGVLTRRLLTDRRLSGTRVVVLDEFHERHLHGDVALAVLKRLRAGARPDLAVVVMSATLDSGPVAAYLGATTFRAEGRAYPVTVEHAKGSDDRALELQVAGAVRAAAREPEGGDTLVFLPGASEIRKATEACARIAEESDLLLLPLHGDLPPAEQDRAVTPQSKRKVVLATNVAESSITIDGVVTVVDSGLARVAGHAPWSGLPTLTIAKISRASAAQRAGRAGRTRVGRCIRLYTQADLAGRPEHDAPEIQRLDLAQTWLELASLDMSDLAFLDPPPDAARRAAEHLLRQLGALDDRGHVTPLGHRLLSFPLHPRQARLLAEAEARGVGMDGAVFAALIGEKDIRRSERVSFRGGAQTPDSATERSDLIAALDLFREAEAARFSPEALRRMGLDVGATRAVSRATAQLRVSDKKPPPEGPTATENALLMTVLAGYPDRVVKRGEGRALARAGGGSAELSLSSVVRDAPWMVAVDADVHRGRAMVRVASAIEPDWLLELFPEAVRESTEAWWDASAERAVARSRLDYLGLVLVESDLVGEDSALGEVLAKAAIARGARRFAPEGALDRWLARARFAATHDTSIAAPDDRKVEATLREECAGKRSFLELRESFMSALEGQLDPKSRARVTALAPDRVTLMGGRAVRVEYDPGKPPWTASRLQDFFGMLEGPRIAEGRVSLVLHLLAPNQRAVQVTADLSGFWAKHYPEIRKELARKYPRHSWPDDPRRPAPPMRPRQRPRQG
jgi:ATP-dependent helicase HrpB